MTGNKILLDTNILSAWLKGDKMIADRIDDAAEVFIPVQALGELYYGAQYSTRFRENMDNISRIIENYEVLNTNNETASLYGVIKAR